MVLGQLSQGKLPPNPKTNPKPRWGNCPDTGLILGQLGFQSSVLHKLKNKLNCRLKLDKDNNRSFLVAHTTSIYLIYKNKEHESSNPKLVKYEL